MDTPRPRPRSSSNRGEPLDTVIATHLLAERPARDRDDAVERDALLQLIDEMGQPSRHALQRIAALAMSLCDAESAGITLVETGTDKPRLRWHALTGAMHEQVWMVMPLEVSPASVALQAGRTELLLRPELHFHHLAEMRPMIQEVLLVPFDVAGARIGTLWIVAHTSARKFDAEDARVGEQLARVARSACQLQQVIDDLRTTNRRKDEFLAVLSHEMRNPLAALGNAVRYLSHSGSHEPDQDRARGVIQRQLAQITRLSEDLLDVSRLGSGAVELRSEPTDLVAAIRAGSEAAGPALIDYDRPMRIELPPEPLIIQGDPARLAQIVINLMTNVARRTRPGGSGSLVARREGDEAVLTVASDTEGVAASWRDGTRSPRNTAREEGVAQGIGLALARSLTELQGGRTSVVDVGEGVGNGFELRFPLVAASAGLDPHAAPTISRRGDQSSERLRRERVLIIDDSVDASDSLAMLLRTWGHDVRTAQGASAGLSLEWDFEPQAVILDIEMPGKNGYEVAAELRVRRRRELLLVALSGHAREEDRARSLAAGFDHHLTKPANVEMLRRLLA